MGIKLVYSIDVVVHGVNRNIIVPVRIQSYCFGLHIGILYLRQIWKEVENLCIQDGIFKWISVVFS